MSEEKALTIFEADFAQQTEEAVKNFIEGRTPKSEIKYREGRGGGQVPYVTGAYMTRQAGLLTAFKWSHRIISKRTVPNFWKAVEALQESAREEWSKADVIAMFKRLMTEIPKEVIVEVEVTLHSNDGTPFTHTATGSKEVVYSRKGNQPVSIGDDEKAAETDAIKKALAYWGIANDVYGSEVKELEAYKE